MSVDKVSEKCEIAHGINRERWAILLEQLSELDELVPNIIKQADKEYWIVEALKQFLELSVKNKQDISLECAFSREDFIEGKKLVKFNRLVPKIYLDLHKFNYVILGSVYVEMPVIIVNKDLSSSLKALRDDRSFIGRGLPEHYHYGTRRFTDDGYLVSLGYNEVCPLYVKTKSDWSYFELW